MGPEASVNAVFIPPNDDLIQLSSALGTDLTFAKKCLNSA